PIVQSTLAYQYLKTGIELQADFRLDVVAERIHEFTIEVDRPLSIVSAQVGDFDLPIPADAGELDEPQLLTFTLPEPISGRDLRARVIAVAPIEIGSLAALPTIRVRNARWQQASATVTLDADLSLADLALQDCRQVPS